MTDFRALCAELVSDIEEWMNSTDHFPPSSVGLLDRARVALAQSVPEWPTDEEILALSHEHGVSYTTCDGHVIYTGARRMRHAR